MSTTPSLVATGAPSFWVATAWAEPYGLNLLGNLPIGLGEGSSERGEKPFVIQIVAEDGFATIPAIHDMVNRT